MCRTIPTLALVASALVSSLVFGRPSAPAASLNYMELKSAEQKTICPFVVKTDFDKDRRPQVLKHVVCAAPAVPESRARHCFPSHQCCSEPGAPRPVACYQLFDEVEVEYADEERRGRANVTVPVGCVCAPMGVGVAQPLGGPGT